MCAENIPVASYKAVTVESWLTLADYHQAALKVTIAKKITHTQGKQHESINFSHVSRLVYYPRNPFAYNVKIMVILVAHIPPSKITVMADSS